MVLKNLASSYTQTFVQAGILILLTPFVVSRLGSTGYGIWALIGSLTGYFGLLDFGVRAAVVKYVAEFEAKEETESLHDTISAAMTFFSTMGILAFVASIGMAFWALPVLNIPRSFLGTAQGALLLTGVGLLVGFPAGVLANVLEGFQRYDYLSLARITGDLSRAVGTVVVLLAGFGLIGLAVLSVGVQVVLALVLYYLVQHRTPGVHWQVTAQRVAIRRIFRFSAWSYLTDVATVVCFKIDEVVISLFMAVSSVTPYAVCAKLARSLEIIVAPMTRLFFPMASALDTKGDVPRLQQILILGTKYSIGIALPVCTLLLFSGGWILSVWMGAEFVVFKPILNVFLSIYLVNAARMTADWILAGTGRLKFVAAMAILEAGANLVLSVFLVGRLGLVGVAIGTLVPIALNALCVTIPFVCRSLQLPVATLLQRGILPPIMATLPIAGLFLIARGLGELEGGVTLGVIVVAAMILYVPSLYLLALSTDERRHCRLVIQRFLKVAEERA